MRDQEGGLSKLPEVLKKRGWIKHQLEDDAGHVCLLGALRVCYGFAPRGSFLATEDYRRGRELLMDCVQERGEYQEITDFNDDDDIVLQDVLEVAECAAGKEQEQ